MSVELIAGIAAFIVLFCIWVIVPSILKRHHESKVKAE